MGKIIRAPVLVAGAIAVLLGLVTSAQADDADDVRRAVMGHEAFIQRCVQDHIDGLEEETGVDSATLSDRAMEVARGSARNVCEGFYKELNVCVAGGAARGILRTREIAAKIEKVLTDPLTRAQDYETYHRLKKTSERELAALHDLKDGRTDYCDTGSDES
ncbi:MAG: hypothetical protein OXH60_10295 [Rhodospirillales bacterium]|nr:hypothetical protein [Rhodospirillales bacterium]